MASERGVTYDQGFLKGALGTRYEVQGEVGRGGMATVYRALDHRLGRTVALKVIHPELTQLLGADRFHREITIAAALQHPNIVGLFEAGEQDGLLYYTMPLVEGETLRDRLEREAPLPVDEAVRIAEDVAAALGCAHDHGIVHRDIKPENILLAGDRAMVTDFGIARAIAEAGEDRLTSAGIVIGTPAYMSPEQGSGTATVDGRSDIYAVGCVLYEMLSGEPPFTGPTPQVVVARQMQEAPRSLRVVRPTVSLALQDVIEKALAKVPADRYATAAEFIAALDRVKSVPRTSVRRQRVWHVALLGLIVAAAVLGGRWVLTGRASRRGAPAARALDPAHVAVLYFEDLTPGRTLSYLASGLTEDLIDELARVPTLHVTSVDGVRPYRERAVPTDSIARHLGVGTIISGSVAQSGSRLRVSVRLVDPATGEELMGETVERPSGELFSLQRQIAQQVSRGLRERVGQEVILRESRAGTQVVSAWEALQRAEGLREQAASLASGDDAAQLLLRADSAAAAAAAQDPAWVEPIVLRGWLANDHVRLPMVGVPRAGVSAGVSSAVWARRGLALAERALRLKPGDAGALELRGRLYYRVWLLSTTGAITGISGPLDKAERDLRAAAQTPFRSQPRALAWLSMVDEILGKFADAYQAAQQALGADAYLTEAPSIEYRLFVTAFELGRDREAIQRCSDGRAAYPDDWQFLFCSLMISGWSKAASPDVDEAWRVVRRLPEIAPPADVGWLLPRFKMLAAAVVARAGLRDSAERVIARARAGARDDPEMLYEEALARIQLGERASALGLLEAYVKASPYSRPQLRNDILLRQLHNDQRFEALVRG